MAPKGDWVLAIVSAVSSSVCGSMRVHIHRVLSQDLQQYDWNRTELRRHFYYHIKPYLVVL